MATRATYKIDGVHFYIHYDGYEEGAAKYFWNMHCSTDSGRGGNAEAFLRGNDLAEFTKSHNAHGDTEYRYDLKGETLTVRKRTGDWSSVEGKFDVVWSGFWWEFVNKYGTKVPAYERLAKINGRIWTRTDLVAEVSSRAETLAVYKESFPEAVGNNAALAHELKQAESALASYDKVEV